MDTITNNLDVIAVIGAAASLVLHAIAPRTKTTKDDTAVKWLDRLLGLFARKKPATPAAPVAREVSGFGVARDHRK